MAAVLASVLILISFFRLLNASNNISVTHDNSKGEVGACQVHSSNCSNAVRPKLLRK